MILDAAQIAALDFGDGNACSPEEYVFLGALVRLLAPATIVEVGTSTGIGTLVMAAALAETTAPAPPGPRLTTIDLPLGRARFGEGLARNRAAFARLAPAADALIDWRIGESHAVLDALAAQGRRADLVFIDGGHTEAIVRGDWERALRLQPRTIVLHDTVHLADVARVTDALASRYGGVTLAYPRRTLPGGQPASGAGHGPGLTIFTGLEVVAEARGAARPAVPVDHEIATALVHDRVLRPSEVRRVVPALAAGAGAPPRELEIVLSGRNDNYGGEDFHERMILAASFNHARLVEAGVPHRFTLVEWNPPVGRPPLADLLRERLPWFHRSWVVSRAWHTWYSENPRLQFMEFFAKNAGIRRATGDWILTTNSDVFLSREVVARLAAGPLVPGTLYRATRLDVDRAMPRDGLTWDRLEDPRYLLRVNEPEPPYYNDAAGDFLLLDRESCHALGGFNERVRFSKIHKDSQFCLQAHHRGLAIEPIGRVFHIDHDGSFVNTKHTYGPGHADAPFGPDWASWQPFWNREDWGLRGAIEETRGASTWLWTPEEAGPLVSLVLHGRDDAGASATTAKRLLATDAAFELLIADPSPALARAMRVHEADARLRLLDRPDVEPGTPAGEALAIAVCGARGRHVALLPGPLEIDGLDALMRELDRPGRDPLAPWVCAIEPARGDEPGLVVLNRRAIDRLGGVDAFAGAIVDDLALRARTAFGVTIVPGVRVRATATTRTGAAFDPSIARAWAALGDRGILPATVVADFAGRAERLTRHVEARLAAELPAGVREVAVWGLGPLTPIAIAALRALGRGVTGVYAPGADGGQACAGLPVQAAGKLRWGPDTWVVSTCASPGDAIGLLANRPMARVVHLAESAALRPAAPPLLVSPLTGTLAHARACRAKGELEAAAASYRAVLRDPDHEDGPVARHELALVQQDLGQPRDAERAFRWLLRRWPEGRAMVAYNLGSLYEREGRWSQARAAFERALADTPSTDAARVGGCHFHLGEIALAEGEPDRARTHFERAIAALPSHGKARARLDTLVSA